MISDFINVKNLGAKGDGVTDDWAAIMAAYNHTTNNERGTIFFPPGTYIVSQPIDFSSAVVGVGFLGVMGASTIVGNFADYIFKRDDPALSGFQGYHVIEKLTIINNNASGSGILMGQCVGAAIRDCNVTANNIAINDGNYNGLCSFEVCVENCTLIGSNVAGSIGLSAYSDGFYVNCYVKGFDQGIIAWGGEGGQDIAGCRIENCATGFQPGAIPPGVVGPGTSGGFVMDGCHFKNCGIAIDMVSSGTFRGILIEGTNGQAPGGTNPQYGIRVNAGHGANVYEGVVVNGQFDQYGIYSVGDENTPTKANMFGVSSTNSGSGSAWGSGNTPVANMSHAPFTKLVGCNIASVTTGGQLIFSSPITSVTCPSNTVTLTWAFGGLSDLVTKTFTLKVSGVPVAGYNGTFQGTITGFNNVSYTVVGPLANSSGGTVVINIKLTEGGSFNVSDADSSSWGDTVLGGGSTHARVRWNGSNLTVMGT